MQAETILQSDLLDILFEHRNRDYGAYELRRQYQKRLYIAVGSVVAFSALLVLVLWLLGRGTPPVVDSRLWNIDTVTLSKMPVEPKQPEQQTVKPKSTNPASLKYVKPTIVPDQQATDTLVEVKHLANSAIGTQTVVDSVAGGPGGDPGVGNPGIAKQSTVETRPEEPAVWETVEVMPSYPGGLEALRRFLARNLRAPESALQPGDRVRVPVHFVVNAAGKLESIRFEAITDPAFEQEIRRVMQKMPAWQPGVQRGRKVAVYYSIPIVFELPEGE